ncbi:type II toxin-antitoxin system mRNA interferase toxin, RelE/StbE family [archaeon]|nr:type II toxin-antitoxin system mRNA interferase toxin, RelE/StbE family [archaeon]|tara:strand:+ start:2568 stop:2837 length:270 start_codon:yes stop_codon:yes gene_type:complete
MVLFQAEFSSKSEKYINKLDKITSKRIKQKIDELERNPFPKEVERVEDYKGEKTFRVRVGKQRILYFVRHNLNRLIIIKIDKRSKVYDK